MQGWSPRVSTGLGGDSCVVVQATFSADSGVCACVDFRGPLEFEVGFHSGPGAMFPGGKGGGTVVNRLGQSVSRPVQAGGC